MLEGNVVHFVLVGDYGKPMACGERLYSNIEVTNKWNRVTCEKCHSVRYSKNRPDKKVMKDRKESLKV